MQDKLVSVWFGVGEEVLNQEHDLPCLKTNRSTCFHAPVNTKATFQEYPTLALYGAVATQLFCII